MTITKKLIIVLLLGIFFCMTASAMSPSDQWQDIGSEEDFTNYLDLDDIQYNAADDSAVVWVKTAQVGSMNPEYYVQQYRIDYRTKKMQSQYFIMYRGSAVLSRRSANGAGMCIPPDSWQNKAADLAAGKAGRSSLYGGSSNWQLVPSTGNEQVYVDSNSLEIDRTRQVCFIWALLKPNQLEPYAMRYKCNFANGTIGIAKYMLWPHMFPPKLGTQAAVYAAARNLYEARQ